jgi:hypothetical protein
VEWPYLHLKKYLSVRLKPLAPLVIWDDEEKSNIQRSKTIMNAIKDSIQFHFPDKYSTIARNEAHVRLMSSTWFMGYYLIKLSFLTILLTVIASWMGFLLTIIDFKNLSISIKTLGYITIIIFVSLSFIIFFYKYDDFAGYDFVWKWLSHRKKLEKVSLIVDKIYFFPYFGIILTSLFAFISIDKIKYFFTLFYFSSIIFSILIFGISLWTVISIEKSLHYQRVREIIYILNTAFQARKIDPEFCSELWGTAPNPPLFEEFSKVYDKVKKIEKQIKIHCRNCPISKSLPVS